MKLTNNKPMNNKVQKSQVDLLQFIKLICGLFINSDEAW